MDTIDDIGRRAATTLLTDVDALADPDAMLEALLARAATGRRNDRSPRRWAIVGAAAAVIVAVVAAVIVIANRDPARELVPTPSVPPSPVPTASTTTPPATTATPAPTTVAPSTPAGPGDGLAVSYKNPPPFLEPQVFGSVASADDGSLDHVQIMESGVVHVDGTTATVVAWDGSTRQVDVSAASDNPNGDISGWAAGPGDLLYAITVSNTNQASLVAVPLSGPREGEAVAATPVSLVVIPERPAGSIGHGATGLVDRIGRIPGVIAPYVDEHGEPWPDELDIAQYRREGDTVLSVDGAQRWPLQIERAPGSVDTLNGQAGPSPAPGGGAVWWDTIGPPAAEESQGGGSMPVIAFLAPDGTATWRRLPDGWAVVAADLWGTVLARRTGTTVELALAVTSVAATPDPTPAEQAVNDYLTALAVRDYAAADHLLGNDGRSPTERDDLAPLDQALLRASDIAGALQLDRASGQIERTVPAAVTLVHVS